MEVDQETPSQSENGGGEMEETKEKSKPVIVMLMGLPGSGKSTFCDEVIRISRRPWARICQDSINNGKAGTKNQCLSSAAAALKNGESIFIDRCNIDREQRTDFLKLGGEQVEKHAVVLDLPTKVCISRSVKRTGHEGNLEGGKAAAVVNRMASKKELPKLSEGFNRITICQDEKDVNVTISTYGFFGPLESLPSGYFGQKNMDTKTQVGIMKFLKKLDPSGKTGSESTSFQKLNPNDMLVEKDSGFQGVNKGSDLTSEAYENSKGHDTTCSPDTIISNNVPTLAFPSISTADFQFNLEKASDVIVEKVEEFVSRIGDAALVLVDLSHGSKILSLVKAKAAQKNIDSKKFFTMVGDITRLRSDKGLHYNVIANAANWRLKPGGGGVNAAIFNAAGSALEIATKEKAACLRPGNSVVVPLPSSSPLFIREGITHVIHVLGPNMNPMRPDCLKHDYVQGCNILREAYSSLFEGFVSILKSHSSSESGDSKELNHSRDHLKGKREATYESDKKKKYKGFQQDLKTGVSSYSDEKNSQDKRVTEGKINAWGSWAQALYKVAMHAEEHENALLEVSDDIIVMNDAYPKAQHHLLVLARADGLDCPAIVRREHISLLKTMHAVGLKWAEKFLNDNQSLSFRLGYHSDPSMRQLHLHVISQDFDSHYLKNKKHWNSFTTPFFRDSVDVIKEVEEHGKIILKDDEFLSMELRCHRCRSAHPNIPRLKSHISSCKAPFPAALLQNGRLVSSGSNNILDPH
ncbi:transcription factor bHLH140 [Primulina eburnea]|uniref:transcription factor bHLH140 n=1 Tax=Primulina eburnea TaxID=1245227 RepID=UPI003C6C327B